MLHVKSVCTPCCMLVRRVARILKELFSEYQSKNGSKDFFPGRSLEVILKLSDVRFIYFIQRLALFKTASEVLYPQRECFIFKGNF